MADVENKPKRKRGRPPKKKAKLPEFKSNKEIREYILNSMLELSMEAKEIARKKNNIKNPAIANAKNQQYKTASACFKVADNILKNIQIDELEQKIELMEEGIYISDDFSSDNPDDISPAIEEKLFKINELRDSISELKQ